MKITFLCILAEPESWEAARDEIHSEMDKLFSKVAWSNGYGWNDGPQFILASLDDLTARDYAESFPMDYYALSVAMLAAWS